MFLWDGHTMKLRSFLGNSIMIVPLSCQTDVALLSCHLNLGKWPWTFERHIFFFSGKSGNVHDMTSVVNWISIIWYMSIVLQNKNVMLKSARISHDPQQMPIKHPQNMWVFGGHNKKLSDRNSANQLFQPVAKCCEYMLDKFMLIHANFDTKRNKVKSETLGNQHEAISCICNLTITCYSNISHISNMNDNNRLIPSEFSFKYSGEMMN